MSENGDSTDGDEHEWQPNRTEDYADGPVLTNRQAETIATLDASDSRASTAALLGIGATTVDDHRQDAQANAVAAIQQLRQLLGSLRPFGRRSKTNSDTSGRRSPNLIARRGNFRTSPPKNWLKGLLLQRYRTHLESRSVGVRGSVGEQAGGKPPSTMNSVMPSR